MPVGRTSVSGRCAGRGGMDHRAISGRERRFLAGDSVEKSGTGMSTSHQPSDAAHQPLGLAQR